LRDSDRLGLPGSVPTASPCFELTENRESAPADLPRLHQGRLVPARLNQVDGDRGLPERLAGLQAMQALNQYKPLAVRPHENGCLLPLFQHALCQGFDLLRIKGLPPLHRHIDVLDRQDLPLQPPPDCSRLVSLGSKLMRRELACLALQLHLLKMGS
jgi:hypothetical protein